MASSSCRRQRGRSWPTNAVVATGTFGSPYTPHELAAELDDGIVQLHSSAYKNPSQLAAGPVLVVGAAHSGADLAREVALAGHHTILCGRSTGAVPFKIEGALARNVLWAVLPFVWNNLLTTSTPIGRRKQPKMRNHGGPLLRYKEKDVVAAGVERVLDRMTGVRDGQPVLGDDRVVSVANVVWCTGFRQDFGWIDLPIVGEDGWPLEHRGVVEAEPGLYFMGLAFQHSFSSTLVLGVDADSRYVTDHLIARMTRQESLATS